MPGTDLLNTKGLENLKYFTVDSNILVGIFSLILSYYEYLYLKYKKEIPNCIYIYFNMFLYYKFNIIFIK